MIQPLPQFTSSPASIIADARQLVEHSRKVRDELVRNITLSAANFANVMLPLAHTENHFALKANILGFYRHVSADKSICEASNRAKTILDNALTEFFMREDMFTLVDAVRRKDETIDEESSLFLKRVLEKHIKTGAGIRDPSHKKRFKAIQDRLSRIGVEFEETLSRDESSIRFTAAELEGVPQSVLSQLNKPETGDEFEAILSNPAHSSIMTHATEGETRKRLFIAYENRCGENAALIQESVVLRHEKALLLGFTNNLEFRLQGKMAQSPEAVNGFLEDVRAKLAPGGSDAAEVLENLKKADLQDREGTNKANNRLFLWDYSFYHSLMLKQKLAYDKSLIREYFPIQTTIAAMLKLVAHLFGIEFTELQEDDKSSGSIWHEDVRVFSVCDDEASGGGFLGYLYMDLFHRPGKFPQPCCFSLQPGFTHEDGTRHHPVAALLCNFPPPTSSKPSLPGHFNTVVMFHELGHGIHHVVSKTRYSRFHGPDGVASDFGEIPSKMLEEWCWTPSQLKLLSTHYSYLSLEMFKLWQEENEGVEQPPMQMPDQVIEALVRSRRLTFGPLFYLDQLHRAIFDTSIDQFVSLEEAKSVDLASKWNKLRHQIQPLCGPEALGQGYTWGHGYTTFGHLISDDDNTGYYSYIFAQVYAADLFYSKFRGDITDSEQGQVYRQCILEKGGAQDEMQSLTHFLGRVPSVNSFNEHFLGLSQDQ